MSRRPQMHAHTRNCNYAIIKLVRGVAGQAIGETNNKLDAEMQNTHTKHYN